MVTGPELATLLNIPYTTIWRRAKDGTIPVHYVPRHALDRKPRMMFRPSEVEDTLRRLAAEREARGD